MAVQDAILHKKDSTINKIVNPISKYVSHVWQGIVYNDYVSLLEAKPNPNIESHEIYLEYRKKLKFKNEKEFWSSVIKLEQEKILYFILTYSQKIVLVKTGEKNEEKQFLGYEFTNRRGNEGIHPMQRGKSIDECTKLFDPDTFENHDKASTYIYQAFQSNFRSEIPESLEQNITRVNLIDLLTFDRADFEKNISLAIKKKVKIESKWRLVKLEHIATMLQRGKSPKYGNSNIQIIKSGQARGYRHLNFSKKYFVDTSFVLDKRKLEKGDILINSSGVRTAGRVTLFDLEGDFVVDSHISILRLDKEKAMPCYVLYDLANIGFKTIEAMATGQSGQIELSLTTIQNIKIPLPTKAIQEKMITAIEVLEKKEKKAKETIQDLKNSIFLIIKNNTNREKLVKLGDVTEIISGGTPDTKNQDYWDGEINWATLRDTKNKYLYSTNKKITALGMKKSSAVLLPINTVIFSSRATIGEVCIAKVKTCTNQGFKNFICSAQIHYEYLYHILTQQSSEIATLSSGMTYPEISKSQIADYKIPLPSKAIQEKMITEVEAIELQIAMLEQKLIEIPPQKGLILKRHLE